MTINELGAIYKIEFVFWMGFKATKKETSELINKAKSTSERRMCTATRENSEK